MDRWHDQDEGLTLVETVVALTVFAIVSAALAAVILNTTALSRNNRSRVVAASLATRVLEAAREKASRDKDLGVHSVEPGGKTWSETVGETTYTLRRSAIWTFLEAPAEGCTTNPGVTGPKGIAYLRVSVDVTWPRMGGATPVHADTLLTPKPKDVPKRKGNIAVSVIDRDGRGGADHLVTVAGAGKTTTQRTTAEGCAFFAFVDADDNGTTYNVSLGTPGYIDPSRNPTPSMTTTVTPNAETAFGVSFQYDRAVPLEFTDHTFPGQTDEFPLKTNAVTIANNSDITERLSFPVEAFPLTVDVFPWKYGAAVWAGTCDDAKPTKPLLLDLVPGTSVPPIAVPAAKVRVTVTHTTPSATGEPADPQPTDGQSPDLQPTPQPTGGQSPDPQPTPQPTDGQSSDPPPAQGVPVTAKHASEDGTCPSSDPLPLGTTSADGTLQVSLPYGRWELDAGGTSIVVKLTADEQAPVDVALVAP